MCRTGSEASAHQPPFQADSIEALAALCKLPAEPLDATLKAYNAACQQGEFQPLTTDSLATKGLDIVKSNWARPISTPPFYAIRSFPACASPMAA
jgi:tricarballylate dehydrogenase